MKVILLKEVKGRGGEGDVINVKDGFASNYLLKEGYAIKATKGELKQLENRKANIAKREEVRIAEANETFEKLNGLKFKADVQIGDEGQLFGAVTNQMIVDGIKKNAGVEIDKRRIDIRKTIRTVGLHEAEVVIYRDIKAKVSVVVGGEDPEKFMEDLKKKKEKKSNKNKSEKKPKSSESKEKKSSDSKEDVKEDKQTEEPKNKEVQEEKTQEDNNKNEEKEEK